MLRRNTKKKERKIELHEDYETVKAFFGGDEEFIVACARVMLAMYDDT